MGKEKKWLTYDSTVGELYESPVGHDALAKVLLQIGLPEQVITNKAVSGLKLRTIANLTKKQLGMDFLMHYCNWWAVKRMNPVHLKGKSRQNGGRKRYFIRFIPAAFATAMGMGLAICRGLLANWII